MLSKIFSRADDPAGRLICLLAGKEAPSETNLLRGDVAIQKALIGALPFSQSHTSGALCFGPREWEIASAGQMQQELMDDFERLVAGGLDWERLSWLWMQHRVGTQIRLVWVVANVDLITGKRFVPYFDHVDRLLFSSWQQYENLLRRLQDPRSSENGVKISYNRRLPRETRERAARLAKYLSEKCASGELNNRDEIVRFLEDELFLNVTVVGRDFITVYMEETKQRYRLTGAIFREASPSADRVADEDGYREKQLSELRDRLDSRRRRREQIFAERYRIPDPVPEEEPKPVVETEAEEDENPAVYEVMPSNNWHYAEYMRNRNSWRWRT